jgi:putative oxidoreductase
MTVLTRIQHRTQQLAGLAEGLPPLAARISVGLVFTQAGWGKLHNLERVTTFFERLRIPAPHLQAPLVAGLEFACGILLLLGLMTRTASLPLIVIMAVAILTVKLGGLESFTDIFGLSEYLLILLLLWLALSGPGGISLDNWIAGRTTTQA